MHRVHKLTSWPMVVWYENSLAECHWNKKYCHTDMKANQIFLISGVGLYFAQNLSKHASKQNALLALLTGNYRWKKIWERKRNHLQLRTHPFVSCCSSKLRSPNLKKKGKTWVGIYNSNIKEFNQQITEKRTCEKGKRKCIVFWGH